MERLSTLRSHLRRLSTPGAKCKPLKCKLCTRHLEGTPTSTVTVRDADTLPREYRAAVRVSTEASATARVPWQVPLRMAHRLSGAVCLTPGHLHCPGHSCYGLPRSQKH